MTSQISRRTLTRSVLAGVAAVPALAVPAIAAVDPDAGLKALFKQLELGVNGWWAYVNGPQKEAEARYDRIAPPRTDGFPKMPAKLTRQIPRCKGDDKNRSITAGEYAIMKKLAPKHPAIVWHDQQMKVHRRKWRARFKSADLAKKQSGLAAAEEMQGKLFDAYLKVYNKLMKMPAHTPAGLAIKARAIRLVSVEPTGGDGFDREWTVLESDILRMAAVA